MNWMYDIYQKLPGGGRLWIESALTLEHAKERLTNLFSKNPGKYLIYDFRSGKPVEPMAWNRSRITTLSPDRSE
jgi:hypothetical protein